MPPTRPVPSTPRVISPSPTPSESGTREGYFTSPNASKFPQEPIAEDTENSSSSDPEFARARSKSREPRVARPATKPVKSTTDGARQNGSTIRRRAERVPSDKTDQSNGFLSPKSAAPGMGMSYWRSLSRSPSPLGLIPIHRSWRTFVHKHEIPRKALHVSIGFFALWLYHLGYQTSDIHPKLLSALIPIFSVDVARMHSERLNRVYIKVCGALMRESEAHDKYNGVIAYLAGAWFVMFFCAKDVALVSILLLSWGDTAASTVGRWLGRYTPRIRKGKSLAGSLAACLVGILVAILFWGLLAPKHEKGRLESVGFAFQGHLSLPHGFREYLALTEAESTVEGSAALAVLSLASGLIVSASEAVDIWGLDDNITIPILCGLGLGGFLKTFG